MLLTEEQRRELRHLHWVEQAEAELRDQQKLPAYQLLPSLQEDQPQEKRAAANYFGAVFVLILLLAVMWAISTLLNSPL